MRGRQETLCVARDFESRTRIRETPHHVDPGLFDSPYDLAIREALGLSNTNNYLQNSHLFIRIYSIRDTELLLFDSG